jgi:hypothetical protein
MTDQHSEIKLDPSAPQSDASRDTRSTYRGSSDIPAVPNQPDPAGVKLFREYSIPIAGLVVVFLLLCLIGHYSSTTVDWGRTKDFTDSFRSVTQGLAFIAGGIWAYFKFVKGRTFQESLTPVVAGKFVSIDGEVFLVVTTQIKNVGLSKITFNQTGSALIIFEYTPTPSPEIHTVADSRLTSFDVFAQKDRYIEPNEIIEGQRLIAIPKSVSLAYRLELEIVSASGYTWQATTIVDKSTLTDNGFEQLLGF